MTDGEKAIMQKAIQHFGKTAQIIVCIEELSELTKELTKYLRDNEHSVYGIIEEAAKDKNNGNNKASLRRLRETRPRLSRRM